MNINDTYHIDLDPDLPGDGDWKCPVYYYPEAKDATTSYQIITVKSQDSRWAGYFAPGDSGKSGVWPVPETDCIVVVASGCAYFVELGKPEMVHEIPLNPVRDVRTVKESNIVLLHDDMRLIALDKNGIKWDTDRIVWDDLKIVAVQSGVVICSGSFVSPVEDQFCISLKDGKMIRSNLPCQVCGNLTLWEYGSDQICPVCYWQEDGLYTDPDEIWGGPNGDLSLTQARANYKKFGAVEKRLSEHVRQPLEDEKPLQ